MGLLPLLARWVRTGDQAITVDRLFSSQHVRDLRFMISVTLNTFLLMFVIGAAVAVENEIVSDWSKIASRKSPWVLVGVAFAAGRSFLPFFVPALAALGAALAWAYQVGSARLGVVDLFGCEISTLCRIATVVDTARTL